MIVSGAWGLAATTRCRSRLGLSRRASCLSRRALLRKRLTKTANGRRGRHAAGEVGKARSGKGKEGAEEQERQGRARQAKAHTRRTRTKRRGWALPRDKKTMNDDRAVDWNAGVWPALIFGSVASVKADWQIRTGCQVAKQCMPMCCNLGGERRREEGQRTGTGDGRGGTLQ